jgi:hypothetical protein
LAKGEKMSKSKKSKELETKETKEFQIASALPLEPIVGAWYQVLTPGGFTLFAQYVCRLAGNMYRFANIRHMRNAEGWELPQMTRDAEGVPPGVTATQHSWVVGDIVVLAMFLQNAEQHVEKQAD